MSTALEIKNTDRLIATDSNPVADSQFSSKPETAIASIYRLLALGYSISISSSFGKDSQALLVLALEALRRAVAGDSDGQISLFEKLGV